MQQIVAADTQNDLNFLKNGIILKLISWLSNEINNVSTTLLTKDKILCKRKPLSAVIIIPQLVMTKTIQQTMRNFDPR